MQRGAHGRTLWYVIDGTSNMKLMIHRGVQTRIHYIENREKMC